MMMLSPTASTDSNSSAASISPRHRGLLFSRTSKIVSSTSNDLNETEQKAPSPAQQQHGLLASTTRLMNHPRRNQRSYRLVTMGGLCLLILFGIGNLLASNSISGSSYLKHTDDNNIIGNNNNVDKKKIQNITAVIMNHARPRNIQESELLPTLLVHPNINEILLLHSNPSTAFHYDHIKVRNLNATTENTKMGLSLRFWFAGYKAKNEWILIVDDDMIIPATTLQALIDEFATNPHRIVGRFGRTLCWWCRTGPITNGYNTVNTKGPTEVVLTKILLMERSIASQFHTYSYLVEHDLIKNSKPYWNGEDIFMNIVANHVYGGYSSQEGEYSQTTKHNAQRGINNYAMPWLEVGDVGDTYKDNIDGKLDVSGNFKGMRQPWTWKFWDQDWRTNFVKAYNHLYYRGNLWRNAKKRLHNVGIIKPR